MGSRFNVGELAPKICVEIDPLPLGVIRPNSVCGILATRPEEAAEDDEKSGTTNTASSKTRIASGITSDKNREAGVEIDWGVMGFSLIPRALAV